MRVASLIGDAARATGLLGAAASFHLAGGGGGWRLGLGLACCAALDVPPADATRLAAACELVHQASIVHDDAQDGTPMRRGRASVAARFGAPVAICVGDHLLACAFGVLADTSAAPALIRLFSLRISDMAAGQAGEFGPALWTDMTMDRYRALARGKSGAAVALPIEGAASLAGLSHIDRERAGDAGHVLGVAYQAGDDTADLAADLRRGALNGVVVHALDGASPLDRARLLALLDRAQRDGLSKVEAAAETSYLAAHAAQWTRWARGTLDGLDASMRGHRLGPVLAVSAASLAARLGRPAETSRAA